MAKKISFMITLLFLVASPGVAHAVPIEPAPPEADSPALQLARRVASMENSKDLPSRAVWLSKKAAASTNLAYQSKTSSLQKKKQIKVQD